MKTCHMLLQTLDWRTWQRCWVRWTQQGIIFYLNLSCLHQRHFSQMRRLRALPCCTALKCELWDKEKRLWTWGFRMLSHLCDLYDQFCWNQYRNCDTHTDFFRDHIYLFKYQQAHPRTTWPPRWDCARGWRCKKYEKDNLASDCREWLCAAHRWLLTMRRCCNVQAMAEKVHQFSHH